MCFLCSEWCLFLAFPCFPRAYPHSSCRFLAGITVNFQLSLAKLPLPTIPFSAIPFQSCHNLCCTNLLMMMMKAFSTCPSPILWFWPSLERVSTKGAFSRILTCWDCWVCDTRYLKLGTWYSVLSEARSVMEWQGYALCISN